MNHRSHCPIAFALDIFGDKWSLLVIRDILFKGRKYYREFLNAGEGISTNILADRLSKLEELGLITKKTDPANRKQYVYSSTDKARELVPMLGEMIAWSAKHDPRTEVPQESKDLIHKDKNAFIGELQKVAANFADE